MLKIVFPSLNVNILYHIFLLRSVDIYGYITYLRHLFGIVYKYTHSLGSDQASLSLRSFISLIKNTPQIARHILLLNLLFAGCASERAATNTTDGYCRHKWHERHQKNACNTTDYHAGRSDDCPALEFAEKTNLLWLCFRHGYFLLSALKLPQTSYTYKPRDLKLTNPLFSATLCQLCLISAT